MMGNSEYMKNQITFYELLALNYNYTKVLNTVMSANSFSNRMSLHSLNVKLLRIKLLGFLTLWSSSSSFSEGSP